MRQGIILATPSTLIALFKAVAYGWRQAAVAEHAAKILDLGQDLHRRLGSFVGHLERAGERLGQRGRRLQQRHRITRTPGVAAGAPVYGARRRQRRCPCRPSNPWTAWCAARGCTRTIGRRPLPPERQ